MSGYLSRLGKANGIHSFDQISAMLFPTQSPRVARNQRDYPPLYMSDIMAATNCSEEELLGTTVYYLGDKFNRATHPQALSRFLSGCIAEHLRFCPFCLNDKASYSLLWRFSFLTGCAKHSARFLEHCSACGQTIPLITHPLKMTICPYCGADFREMEASPLSASEAAIASAWTKSLTFLLQPMPKTHGTKHMTLNGKLFTQRREERGLGLAAVADLVRIPLRTLYLLERQRPFRPVPFQHYVRYAMFLTISLETLFDQPETG